MGALYFITGSCGSGKSTLLAEIRTLLPAVHALHSDDLGVPPAEEMVARFGSGDAWQAHRARELVETAAANPGVTVVDGQARPHVVLNAAREAGVAAVRVVLVDCGHDERRVRLLEQRKQPELDNLHTYAWAAYLKGQADALGLEVIDTTGHPVAESAAALRDSIVRFAAESGVRVDGGATLT
jgi:hypothetical protein